MRLAYITNIKEIKETLNNIEHIFNCKIIDRKEDQIVVLYQLEEEVIVSDIVLPKGTFSYGYFWANRPYNIYHFIDPEGRALAYYFNIADQTKIEEAQVSWRDLVVDVLVDSGCKTRILDENELPSDLTTELARYIAHSCECIVKNAPHVGV